MKHPVTICQYPLINYLGTIFKEACESRGFFMLKVASKSQGADEQNEFGKICLKMIEEAKKVFTLPANEKEKLVCDETSQNFYQGKHNGVKL